jgi:hypothetical protein
MAAHSNVITEALMSALVIAITAVIVAALAWIERRRRE